MVDVRKLVLVIHEPLPPFSVGIKPMVVIELGNCLKGHFPTNLTLWDLP